MFRLASRALVLSQGGDLGVPCPLQANSSETDRPRPTTRSQSTTQRRRTRTGCGMSVGFLGVGAMGLPMAVNVLAELPVIMYDLDHERIATLADRARPLQSRLTSWPSQQTW